MTSTDYKGIFIREQTQDVREIVEVKHMDRPLEKTGHR